MSAVLGQFRDALIPSTIRNGLRIPFYEDLWRQAAPERVRTVDNLHLLPAMDRVDYQERFQLFWTDQTRGRHFLVTHTSGTTGKPLDRYRSEEELDYIQRFFASLHRSRGPSPGDGTVVVDTTNAEAAHGGAIRIPQPRTVLSVPMNGPVDVERVVEALAKPHPVAGELRFPEGLNTTAHQLVILTSFLAEQGIDPRRAFRVRWMRTSSAYLNAGATRRISALWGIPIGDQFSLSEIFGGAWKCLTCGWYHPDPFVAPEVVDQRTGARLVRGPGVLVLTELFPFVQAHPFIRYWTGDVVEAGPTDCEGSPFAFRYLGRTGRRPGGIGGLSRSLPKHASQGVVSDEDGTLLVGPAPLLDLLGDEEGIAREPIGGAWGERPDPLGLGKPMFALRFEPGRPSVVRLSVSVDRPDELDPALAARLHAVLLDHNPELASRFAQKRLAIDVAFVDRGRHHDDAHRTGSVPGGR